MKQQADRYHSEREFNIRDWVYIRLRAFRQTSISVWKNLSLSPRFCGPFQVLQCIGKVAYRLDLLADVHIHPIFHVSCLKKKIGEKAVSQSALPTVGDDGRIRLEPIVIWDRQLVKKNNCAAVKVLVQWSNSFAEDVTWEDWDKLRARFSRRTVIILSYSRIALIKLELMENMLMEVVPGSYANIMEWPSQSTEFV